jgi:hypothetical protein
MADPFAPLPETFSEDEVVTSLPWRSLSTPTSAAIISARNRCEAIHKAAATHRQELQQLRGRMAKTKQEASEARAQFDKATSAKKTTEARSVRARHQKLIQEHTSLEDEVAVAQAQIETDDRMLARAVAEWRSAVDVSKASSAKGKGKGVDLADPASPSTDRKRGRGTSVSDTNKLSPSAPKPKRSRGELKETDELPQLRAGTKSPVKRGQAKAIEDFSTLPGAKPVKIPCDTCTMNGHECFTTAALTTTVPMVCIRCKKGRRGCSKVLRKSFIGDEYQDDLSLVKCAMGRKWRSLLLQYEQRDRRQRKRLGRRWVPTHSIARSN